ncbi:electron transfer flavoprotein subunit beta/FixA family protein [Actinomyces sp. B33]|uniref:electron transfer flavoprotein subunit beta/FixA family protein n=1 Tax=Actinomyces sp. B33 TaxID=2942131 RepID=UPI0023416FAC|nr:electron transfer flavoprotein subunit beta/FixA family protein [Actinomyces sp. B33]MDC4232874.1 electron transfer flavoprotein subunit beta/FixA family protein [Actinomyces sp. B33]
MRIVVCVKHVPDAQSERRFEDGRMVRGEDDVLNELDENAVEAAVSLVEEHGGEAIALTMGPEDAEDALMRALQMGADRAVLVTDDRLAGSDVVTTAAVLAAAITRLGEEAPVDLVITGMASLDAMTSMLPAALATRLRLPLLGLAHALDVDPQSGVVEVSRSADGYEDRLRAAAPVVVSITDQLNEPRYPAFAAMKAARSKPLDQWGLDDLASTPGGADLAERIPATRVVEAHENARDGAGTIIADAGDAGVRLAQYLLEVVK